MDGTGQFEPNGPHGQTVLPLYVKRALAYMNNNLSEKIALRELARACAASERTLLKQFQRFLEVSPLAYLRRLRLNMARRELLETGCDDAISDIAIRCGYPHLGRFAGEYRRLFGESPSATRRRARERVADGASCLRSLVAVAGREKPSLLILPLRTETLQESLEARDLSERLGATLSRMRIASVALAHPSRSLAMNAPQPRNVRTQYCLLGRLTQRGERLRVIVRLVDVAADRHVWGDSFDGSANDPFELQDRVVDGMLCGVVAHITDAEIERACDKGPTDLGARDLVLRALPLILNANARSAQKAVAILKHAVDMDPSDAAATALLAFSQIELIGRYATASPRIALDAAVRLSQRAALLDSNDPLVLVARGGLAAWQMRFDEADALLTRALAIDPTSTWAWERYAYSQLSGLPIGARDRGESHDHGTDARLSRLKDHAIPDFQRALQLRGPGIARSNCFHGIASAHCMAGRWEDAKLWMNKAQAENPDGTWIHRSMSALAFQMGDPKGVAQSVDRMRRAHPYLTVSYHAAAFPVTDPHLLEALAGAGMPLS